MGFCSATGDSVTFEETPSLVPPRVPFTEQASFCSNKLREGVDEGERIPVGAGYVLGGR